MVALLLLLQLTTVPSSTDPPPRTPVGAGAADSTYESSALREFVAAAATTNRLAPRALRGYQAAAQSELAIVAVGDGEVESVLSAEQIGSRLHWQRSGVFDQRVIGHRVETLSGMAMLGFFDSGWIVPTLYGNRMALFFGRDTAVARRRGDGRQGAEARRRSTRRQPTYAVHPLAEDRDRVYRYRGGDTVATIRVQGRTIPIVRLHVEPRADLDARTFVFRGELHVDASRHHLVRMRGQFLVAGGRDGLRDRLARTLFTALAFVELENQEVAGRYWLPAYQRLELLGGLGISDGTKGVVRLITRVRDYALEEDETLALETDSAEDAARADTLVAGPHGLVVDRSRVLARFSGWWREPGEEAAATHSSDFADVAPPRLRPTGDPVVDAHAESISDYFRFNRVEGAFTGAAVRWRLRDRAPGVTARATIGHAWAENTVRGRASVERRVAPWILAVSAGRTLDLTNDFRTRFDSSATLEALLSSRDPYDYVDRRWATVTAGAEWRRRVRLLLAAGPASDRQPTTSVAHGLVRGDGPFRPVRGIRAGNYTRTSALLELNRDIQALFLGPGVGGLLRYERGDGGLQYERLEARLDMRQIHRGLTALVRADGGIVTGAPIPPQQLFELGGDLRLPGYRYKEFAGDRAAVVEGELRQALPLLRGSVAVRVPRWRTLYLPAPAPTIGAGVTGGWTGARDETTLTAIRELGLTAPTDGSDPRPLSRPSEIVRAAADLRLRFFGGLLTGGLARPLESGARWRAFIRIGG